MVAGMGDGALGQVVGRHEGRCEIRMLKAGWVRGGGNGIEWGGVIVGVARRGSANEAAGSRGVVRTGERIGDD